MLWSTGGLVLEGETQIIGEKPILPLS